MGILEAYIKDRTLNRNKNFAMVFVGATGSGKSYAGLKLAETLDPDFDVDRCCFRDVEFMDKINELTTGENTKKGTVIMWDEFGVDHSAREFMTISNRVINYFFQTSRHYNLVIIVTVPLLSFIDSNTRKLMHSVAEMNAIDMWRKQSTAKVKMIQTNVITGKEYPKFLRYKKNGKMYAIKTFKFGLPSKGLLKRYEKKKKEFTAGLFREIKNDLVSSARKKTKVKELTELQEEIVKLWDGGMTNQTEIAKTLGTIPPQICRNISWIKNKGYTLERRKKNEIRRNYPQK